MVMTIFKRGYKTYGVLNLFFRIPVYVVVEIWKRKTAYVTEISKAIDVTYSHTSKAIQLLEELELVKSRKEGRVRRVELTERGKELGKMLAKSLGIIREAYGKSRDKG